MRELTLLVHLAGEAALLLWGLHMVQSGVERSRTARRAAVEPSGAEGLTRLWQDIGGSGVLAAAALRPAVPPSPRHRGRS